MMIIFTHVLALSSLRLIVSLKVCYKPLFPNLGAIDLVECCNTV